MGAQGWNKPVHPTEQPGPYKVWMFTMTALGLTTTWKLPVVVLPAGSCAPQITVVVPIGKTLPDGGVQLAVS
jgi:hypothetical protein